MKRANYELEIQIIIPVTVYDYVTINYSDAIIDILPKARNMIKYEVNECRWGDFHFGPDSHLLYNRLVIWVSY